MTTPPGKLSRREFFARTAVYGGSVLVGLQLPRALRAAQSSTEPAVFSPAQWRTVEAITGRIIPTDAEPGAIEAGCVNFIDKALANEDAALRPQYEAGLPGIDAVSRHRFEKPFVELRPAEQDAILEALESGEVEGWTDRDLRSDRFFATVRTHTVWGFLADPHYGGNRDYVGWELVGYPGPRHKLAGYTPEQMVGEAEIEPVWRKR